MVILNLNKSHARISTENGIDSSIRQVNLQPNKNTDFFSKRYTVYPIFIRPVGNVS